MSKKRHFLFTPNFEESRALLQFDTKDFSIRNFSLITFVFPFYFGPRYLELNLKLKKKKDWTCTCNGCIHHSVIFILYG